MAIQFWDGKPLIIGGEIAMHEDCCCGNPWDECFDAYCDASDIPEEIIADFGVGGWTTRTAGCPCPGIAGQYVLSTCIPRASETPNDSSCTWGYCEYFCQDSGDVAQYLIIWANVTYSSPGKGKWRLTIEILPFSSCETNPDCRYFTGSYSDDRALWHSAEIDHDASCVPSSPLSLSKVGDSHDIFPPANAVCAGSMPNTITLTF